MAIKPTKKDFAAEVVRLCAAAQDMNLVLELDPPIEVDFNTDLKDKKVTVKSLQEVISELQTEIKETAEEIGFKDTDVFESGTMETFAALKIDPPDLPPEDLEKKAASPADKPVEKKADAKRKKSSEKKKASPKKEKPPSKARYTRFSASLDAMIELGIDADNEVLVPKAAELFMAQGGPANLKEETIAVNRCKTIIGLIKEKNMVL